MFCLWDYVFCVYDHLKPYVSLGNIVLGITGRDCCDLTQMSTLSLFFSIFLRKLNESMIHDCKQPSTPKYIFCFFWWSSYPSCLPFAAMFRWLYHLSFWDSYFSLLVLSSSVKRLIWAITVPDIKVNDYIIP